MTIPVLAIAALTVAPAIPLRFEEAPTPEEFAVAAAFLSSLGADAGKRESWRCGRDHGIHLFHPDTQHELDLKVYDAKLRVHRYSNGRLLRERKEDRGSRSGHGHLNEAESAARMEDLLSRFVPERVCRRISFQFAAEGSAAGKLGPYVQDLCGGARAVYERIEPEGPLLGGGEAELVIDTIGGRLIYFERSPIDVEITSRADSIGEASARMIAASVALREFGLIVTDLRSKAQRGFSWPGDHPGNEIAIRTKQPLEARLCWRFVFYEASGSPGNWQNLFVQVDAATGKCMGAFLLNHPG